MMTHFTGVPPHVIILSVIGGIPCRREDVREGVFSKMIEELNDIYILGVFNCNQIRDLL